MFSIGLTLAASVFFAALAYAFSGEISTRVFNNSSLEPVIRIFAVAIPFAAVGKIAASASQGLKDATWQNILSKGIPPFTRVGFIAVFAVVGLSTINVAYAYVLAWGITAAAGIYYIHTRISFSRSYTVESRELIRFSLPLLFAGGMAFISSSIDPFLLGYFLSTERVGIYNAAYPLANLVLIAPSLLGTLFTPIMSEYHAEGDLPGMRLLYKINTRWLAILTLPGYYLMLLTPTTFLEFVFGPEYTGGGLSMVIVSSGFLVFILLGNNGSVVNMVGRSDVILWTNVVNAAVNVGLNVFLIPRIGIEGAAIATAVSFAGSNLLISAILFSETRIRPAITSLIITILLIALIETAIYSVLSMQTSGIVLILLVYVLTLVLFLPMYLLTGVSDDLEKSLLERYTGIRPSV
jgi:O-antigen/teichoic acid export membrane protein